MSIRDSAGFANRRRQNVYFHKLDLRNILSKGIKILWLAQSSYLIDQAAKTFMEEVHNAAGREKINLRVVSGSTSHANAGTISLTDDVLICTTQTAISAYSSSLLTEWGSLPGLHSGNL